MNEYEIENALCLLKQDGTPNLARAATVLDQLKEWTNAHSDGWPYWQKPKRASAKLQALVQDGVRRGRAGNYTDATREEVARAFTPIKAFLTRQKVDHREIFGG